MRRVCKNWRFVRHGPNINRLMSFFQGLLADGSPLISIENVNDGREKLKEKLVSTLVSLG